LIAVWLPPPTQVDEFEALCKHAAADVRSRFPAAAASPPPMFIAGHSLGGLIAALTCLRDQSAWAGLLVCSPALDVEWSLVLRQAGLGLGGQGPAGGRHWAGTGSRGEKQQQQAARQAGSNGGWQAQPTLQHD
jgi:alpha-beta hydrolase superfamily lysophospholipase